VKRPSSTHATPRSGTDAAREARSRIRTRAARCSTCVADSSRSPLIDDGMTLEQSVRYTERNDLRGRAAVTDSGRCPSASTPHRDHGVVHRPRRRVAEAEVHGLTAQARNVGYDRRRGGSRSGGPACIHALRPSWTTAADMLHAAGAHTSIFYRASIQPLGPPPRSVRFSLDDVRPEQLVRMNERLCNTPREVTAHQPEECVRPSPITTSRPGIEPLPWPPNYPESSSAFACELAKREWRRRAAGARPLLG